MALASEITSITQRYFLPKMVDNVFNSNPLMRRWKKDRYRKAAGGSKVIQPLLFDDVNASGWYSGADTLDTAANDIATSAEWDWKQLFANITVTRLDELKNSGPAQVINLVKSKVQAAEKTMKDKMGTALLSDGSTANSIEGMKIAAAATGTFGNIPKATYSWWQGSVDSTTTVLTIKALQSGEGDVTIDSDRPTVHITTQDLFDDYYGTLQPQQRFADTDTARGGFKSLMFNGNPVIVDSHCDSSYWYMINENYVELVAHKDEDFRMEPFIKPTNQNVSTAKIYWTGAFTCSAPRQQKMFTALA